MLPDTISKIEERIQNSEALNPKSRAELLELLQRLKLEIGQLSKTNGDQAQSIAGFTEVSAYEATRETKNPTLLKHSIQGLESSVSELEQTHPQLAAVVNRIAEVLANMGI